MDRDDAYGAVLLRPLDREPVTPSTVDISRAVADGERHQRRVRLAGGAAAAVVVALAMVAGVLVFGPSGRPDRPDPAVPPSPSVPPPSRGPVGPAACTAKFLPMPPGQGTKSVVTGGDPSGRYILGRAYPDTKERHPLLIWDRGQVSTVIMPGTDEAFADINSAGVAVGYSFVGSSDDTAAYVYKDGKVTRLAGGVAEAWGINESGVIVGKVKGKPAMWRTPTSQPTMLALPGPKWVGYANGIDEDGTIIGRLNPGDATDVGFVWAPDGSVRQLPPPTVQGGPASSYTAEAIRNGWVVGWGARDVGDSRLLGSPRWNLRTGQVDTTFAGHAETIGRDGWVAGATGLGAGLLVGDRVVNLPKPDTTAPIMTLTPRTISDDGTTLAGYVNMQDIETRAVVWTCR